MISKTHWAVEASTSTKGNATFSMFSKVLHLTYSDQLLLKTSAKRNLFPLTAHGFSREKKAEHIKSSSQNDF